MNDSVDPDTMLRGTTRLRNESPFGGTLESGREKNNLVPLKARRNALLI